MNAEVVVVELVRGRDGKLYAPQPLPRAEVNRRRWLAHRLICEQGLSIRQAQAAMRDRHGIRRSIGAICQDIRRFECPACAEQPAAMADG